MTTLDKSQFKISHNEDPNGDEKLGARGRAEIGVLSPEIDPIANGFSFIVTDSQDNVVLTRTIPGILANDVHSPGWQTNNAHTRWVFRDPSGTLADGITQVMILNQSSAVPGRYAFKLKGKGSFQVLLAQIPVRLVAIFGAEEQQSLGQCGQRLFNPSTGLKPRCKVSAGGKSLVCG